MSEYSDAAVLEMLETKTFTRETAQEFAIKHGKSLKSVITKITRTNGVEYQKAEKVQRPIARTRKVVVTDIENLLDVDVGRYDGLTRASLKALNVLYDDLAMEFANLQNRYMEDVETALSGVVPDLYDEIIGDPDNPLDSLEDSEQEDGAEISAQSESEESVENQDG